MAKSKSHYDVAHLHSLNQCHAQISPSYISGFPKYYPEKILKVKVIKTRSNLGRNLTYTPQLICKYLHNSFVRH